MAFSNAKFAAIMLTAITTDASTLMRALGELTHPSRNQIERGQSTMINPPGEIGRVNPLTQPLLSDANRLQSTSDEGVDNDDNEQPDSARDYFRHYPNTTGKSSRDSDAEASKGFCVFLCCAFWGNVIFTIVTLIVTLRLGFRDYGATWGCTVATFLVFTLLAYLGDLGMRKFDTSNHRTNSFLNTAGAASLAGILATGTGVVWQATSTAFDAKFFDRHVVRHGEDSFEFSDAEHFREGHNKYLQERPQSIHDADNGIEIDADLLNPAEEYLKSDDTKNFLQNELNEHLGIVDPVLLFAFVVFIAVFACLFAVKVLAWMECIKF